LLVGVMWFMLWFRS